MPEGATPYGAQGAQLRRLRQAAGLYQRDVADSLGLTKQSVSEWERGNSRPDAPNARRLGEIIGAPDEVLALYGYDGGGSVGARLQSLEEAVRAQSEVIARLVQVLNLTIDLDVATEVAKTRRRKK